MKFHYDCGPGHKRSAGRGRGFSFGPSGFNFDFGEGRGRGGRGGGPRGDRRRMFEGGELRLVLLKLIADEPRHGYELIKAIEDLTEGEYAPSPGVVYPTLTMLDDMGFIAQQQSEGAKKAFAITDAGTAELEANKELVDTLNRSRPTCTEWSVDISLN